VVHQFMAKAIEKFRPATIVT